MPSEEDLLRSVFAIAAIYILFLSTIEKGHGLLECDIKIIYIGKKQKLKIS